MHPSGLPSRGAGVAVSFAGSESPIASASPQTAVPFGDYVLLRKLAVGGMAELFLARHAGSDGLVVIKRILPHLSGQADFVGMFLDEARIAAQLHHANIVQVHELGRLDRSLFIAMEYVEGIDLRKILRREVKAGRTVPYGIAAQVVAQVCAGLHYAHNAVGVDGKPLRVIHRDVSPQNVMVGFDGRVKLVDFGIAKAGAMMERSKPGIIKGKFLYLSPEQVSQDRIDHRADLFALGTMLYEVTTGKSPFQKPNTEAVIYAIRSEEPKPPSTLKADYPADLELIVLKCLAKDRKRRYGSAAEIQRDLQTFLGGNSQQGTRAIAAYVETLFGGEGERTDVHFPNVTDLAAGRENPFGAEPTITEPGDGPSPSDSTPKLGFPPPLPKEHGPVPVGRRVTPAESPRAIDARTPTRAHLPAQDGEVEEVEEAPEEAADGSDDNPSSDG